MNTRLLRLSVTAGLLFGALFFAAAPTGAQFATPTVDGAIGPGEYGTHADGQNQQSTGTGQTWHMTWDDTHLYVAVTNANLSEGAVLYLDGNPIAPVNGGGNGDGSLAGFNYDNTNFAALPFRADFVTYFKDGYREYRTADGGGGWTGAVAFAGSYASGPGNVRELSIPWSALTGGGRPSAFLFFAYLTSPGGFVFGQVPQENPSAFIGTAATASRYYTISSTADGASTKPFSVNSSSDSNDIHWLGLRHDTFDPYYRSPFGAVPAGGSVTLRFRTERFDVDGVSVRVYTYDTATGTTSGPADQPMAFLEDRDEGGTLYAIWSATLSTPATPSILYYKFRITDGVDVDFYSDAHAGDHDNLNQGGEGAPAENEPFPAFQITVYDPAFETPAWLHSANVYQIFPDRFRNGDPSNDYCVPGSTTGCPTFYDGGLPTLAHTTWNEAIGDPRQPGPYFNTYGTQFYGGDLAGIQAQLDYLQSVGIDTLYLTPIFVGRSNHRYDTDNYLAVDPALGGDAAFEALASAMEQRGMRLLLDGVFNHTSSDSLYFDRYHRYPSDGACESLASAFRPWYVFHNLDAPCDSGDYEGWFGFDSLAVLQDGQAAVRDFIFRAPGSVMAHWFEQGAAGWRFDVADEISHDWWRELRPYARSYQADGPLVGEVWPDASRFLAGDQLDSVMNYRFRKNVLGFARGSAGWSDNDNNGANTIVPLTPSQFDHALRAVREDYPPAATAAMLNLLDSHDTNRVLYVLTLLGDSGLTEAKQRLRLAALFQFTYVGAPMVYYGDEAGLNSPSVANGPNGPEDDPYNRAPYPWADESGDASIYGPADAGLVAYYSALAHLRQQHAALRVGEFVTLLTGDTTPAGGDDNTYAYARVDGSQAAVVALNNGAGANTASVPVGAYFADGTVLQDALGGPTYVVTGGQVNLSLPARSGVLLLPAPAAPDLTAPAASAAPNPPANAAGWHNTSPVAVELTGTDGESGLRELRYWVDDGAVSVQAGDSASAAVSAEGDTTVSVRAIDNAGNVSAAASVTVRLDTTPPVVTCPNPAPQFTLGQAGAVVEAAVSDTLSGPQAATVSAAVSTAAVGTFTADVTGLDRAGNSTTTACAYSVVYHFSGFLAPVQGLPAFNQMKAGRAVPVKFSLAGDQGLAIFAAGYPKSEAIACDSDEVVNGVDETTGAGNSGLQYDAATDTYTYVWKTQSSWANACRQLVIALVDGTVHRANFWFTP